jgi:hypothetical protein
MSIAPDEVADPFIPSRMLREALSWKLASEFHRRHPSGLTIIETHPGGGQYDCLTFIRQGEGLAHLNRVGSFTPTMMSSAAISWDQLWKRGLMDDGIGEVLDQMSRACGLSVPSKLPPTSKESLAYRVMAGIIASVVFDQANWEWSNGQEDTAGYENQLMRDRWFEKVPTAAENQTLALPDDVFGNPKYRYWFLLRDEVPVLCIAKDSLCYGKGGSIDLMARYQANRHILDTVASALALIP